MTNSPTVIEPAEPAKAAVIWLHGLGANGDDFVPIVPALEIPEELGLRFIFPHAPERPVTLNNGFVMPAWYDILGLDRGSEQDIEGLRAADIAIQKLIDQQIEQGISADKIVLAGFSQGGALALHTGLRYPQKLAGVMGLSTYLPVADYVAAEKHSANLTTSFFLAHGDADPVLPLDYAQIATRVLEDASFSIELHIYRDLAHTVSMEEVADISRWLQMVLGNKKTQS